MQYRLLLLASVVLAGCNNQHGLGATDPRDETDGAPALSDDDAATNSTGPREAAALPDARTLETLGPLESWTGYVENLRFPSGSDTIKLSYGYDSSGQVVGSVVFGNGTPPSPATDPNVGYPSNMDGRSPVQIPTEGLSYSIATGTFTANRLRFTVNAFEPWDGWCRLQPAPQDGSDMCLPNWGGGSTPKGCYQTSPAGKDVTVDCGKLTLCLGRICLCSSVGCVQTTHPSNRSTCSSATEPRAAAWMARTCTSPRTRDGRPIGNAHSRRVSVASVQRSRRPCRSPLRSPRRGPVPASR
jgi:hypothetical protein